MVTALGLLGGILASCTSGGGEGGKTVTPAPVVPLRGGRLVYGLETDVNTYLPLVDRWAISGQVVAQTIYEPLATFDDAGNVRPYLAESIAPNAEFTTWTITMREGIRFHDGTPLDAAAVKLNLEKHGAGSGSNFSALFGVSSVDVVDARTLRLTMARPWATFPSHLTGQTGNQAGYIVAPAMLEAGDPKANFIGTGPFEFVSWTPNEKLTVTRNPDYWRPGLPYLDEIEFRFITDHDQRVDALRRGDVDVIVTPSEQDPERLRGDFDVVTSQTEKIARFVLVNASRPPLDDAALRRALAQAIDRDAILQRVEGGAGETATGPFSRRSPWFTDVTYPAFDPDAARAFVARYEADHGPVTIQLMGVTNPEMLPLEQMVRDQWEAVGVATELVTVEQRALVIAAGSGNYQAMAFRFIDGVTPDDKYPYWHSATINPPGAPSLNLARFGDAAIDAALDRARATTDRAVHQREYAEVQRRMAETLVFLWLYRSAPSIVANPRVIGLTGATLPDSSTAMTMVSGRTLLAGVWLCVADRGQPGCPPR